MKKLLYISANSKDESASSCKTVARRLIDALFEKDPSLQLQELDLYQEHIPQLKGCYFESRSAIVNQDARKQLSQEEQREVAKIEQLCDQFRDADYYILAAPMWSLSFPAPVKEYIDCIIQSGKTIEFHDSKPQGLLQNKPRTFIYVQSSGANLPWIVRPALNKGLNYVHEIMKFMGVENFEELLVDGTGVTEQERQDAIEKATDRIEPLINKLTL